MPATIDVVPSGRTFRRELEFVGSIVLVPLGAGCSGNLYVNHTCNPPLPLGSKLLYTNYVIHTLVAQIVGFATTALLWFKVKNAIPVAYWSFLRLQLLGRSKGPILDTPNVCNLLCIGYN
jgi:hypothetical protein